MAAGLGFKDFTTGEVLTAADVDGYLMQNIWVFASAAARDAAVTSPQEGNACYLKDTNQVLTYSGSAWVAVGGGSPLTTKGDVYGFSTVDARIPIGANNTVLTADSTQALGLKWAAPASGKVLQVVQATTSTAVQITATSMQDTGITCSITPTSATSKVLVLINGQVYAYKAANGATGDFQIVRNATAVLVCDGASGYFAFGVKVGANTIESAHIISTAYLDSPATTSATTYKLQAACNQASELDWQNNSNHTSTIVLMEIGA